MKKLLKEEVLHEVRNDAEMSTDPDVLEYDLITADARIEFVSEVQARLDAGWQLAGGVSILVDPDDGVTYYSQAVTRRKVK